MKDRARAHMIGRCLAGLEISVDNPNSKDDVEILEQLAKSVAFVPTSVKDERERKVRRDLIQPADA